MAELATSYSKGVAAEEQVKKYLQNAGYAIIAERYRNAGGEIDLIALDENTLIFIEVKQRKTLEDGLYAITERQQKRIVRAAEGFLSEHPEHTMCDMRFDAVIVTASGLPNHIKHAFMCA